MNLRVLLKPLFVLTIILATIFIYTTGKTAQFGQESQPVTVCPTDVSKVNITSENQGSAVFGREIAEQLQDISSILKAKAEPLVETTQAPCVCPTKVSKATDPPVNQESISFRRNVAEQLLEISSMLKGVNGSQNSIIKLNSVISMLDPRFNHSLQDLLTTDKAANNTKGENDADVCDEIYLGRKHGFPYYQKGFKISPSCKRTKKRNNSIADLVTILMLSNGIRLKSNLEGIFRYNEKIRVLIASHNYQEVMNITADYKHVKLFPIHKNYFETPGKLWNLLVNKVNTPYALIAKDLSHFTNYANLNRLVHALPRSSTAGVAAGAFRNMTGHWKLGCHQTDIKNYFLRFAAGYVYSAQDCIFCDHVSGPFVSKTEVLKRMQFDENLNEDILFEDWFLQLKEANVLTVNCPDVMFFTQGTKEEISLSETSWLSFAIKWKITRIFIPPNFQVMFSCKQLSLSCDPWDWTDHYLLPTCCFQQVMESLNGLNYLRNEMSFKYELDSGSQLAAVKLQGHSPWDLDGDFQYDEKFYDFFKEREGDKSDNMSYVKNFEDDIKKFKYFTPDIYLEMWSMTELSSTKFLPEDVKKYPTLMQVLGVWVPGQANPGLYARNKYGPNHFKHALFYLFNERGEWDEYKIGGNWMSCPNNEHNCLARYPTDGSVHFTPHFFENLGLSWDKI